MENDSGSASSLSPRTVNADRGVGWISDGWTLFMQAPGVWALLALVSLGVTLVCGMVPLLGGIAMPFISALVSAGMLLAARKQQEGGTIEVGDLFAILSHTALKPLLLVALIYVALSFGAAIIVFGLFGLGGGAMMLLGGAAGGDNAALAAGVGSVLLGVLVYLAVLVPIMAMYWFAVPLVLFRGLEPWRAMTSSLAAVLANLVPFLVYGVVWLVIAVIASIPLMLGWLAAIPLLVLSWLISYQEIYPGNAPPDAASSASSGAGSQY